MKIPEIPKLEAYRLGTALVMGAVIGASIPGFTIIGGAALLGTWQVINDVFQAIMVKYNVWKDFRNPLLLSAWTITKASSIYSIHRLAALSISLFPAYIITIVATTYSDFFADRLCYYFHPELTPLELKQD